MRRAQKIGYEALAITDECSLAGIVRAHEAASETGFKLIAGSEFRFTRDEAAGGTHPASRIVLLAQSKAGYESLVCTHHHGAAAQPEGVVRLLARRS